MATEVVAVTATGVFVANGPEDDSDGGPGIYIRWRDAEHNVARLGQWIFKAVQAEDSRKVRSLQKLLLRSLSNTLVSVRRLPSTTRGARPQESTGRSP